MKKKQKKLLIFGIGIVVVLALLFFLLIFLSDKEAEKINKPLEEELFQNKTLPEVVLLTHNSTYMEKYNLKEIEKLSLDRGESILRLLSEGHLVEFTNFQGNLYFLESKFVGFGVVLFDDNFHFFPNESQSFFQEYLPEHEGTVFDLEIEEEGIKSSYKEENYILGLDSIIYEGDYFVASFPIGISENKSVEIYFRSKISQ